MKYLFPVVFLFILCSCGENKKASIGAIDIDSLLVLYPDSVDLLVERGNRYLKTFEFDKAIADGAKAFRIDSNNLEARLLFADILNNKPDRSITTDVSAAQRHYKFALNNEICLEYYRTAVSLQPKNPDVLFSLAYAYQLFNQPAKALALYRKMIQVDTAYYQALNQIGVIKQYNYKEIDSAIYFYKSALQTEPRFVQAWHNLGMCYEERGDVSQALQSYGKALKYDPNFEMSRERADQLKNAR